MVIAPDVWAVCRVASGFAPGFKGHITVNPETGIVNISNAQPAGTYTVMIKMIKGGNGNNWSETRTLTLTVTNPTPVNTISFTNAAAYRDSLFYSTIKLGDFNNDGKLDLAELYGREGGLASVSGEEKVMAISSR